MGLKDLHLKLKVFRLRRFLVRKFGKKRGKPLMKRQPSWMMPVSHGYQVIEDHLIREGWDWEECDEHDSVVVQREQIEELELWFYGVFDALVGDSIIKYMQSNFFGKKLKQSEVRRKSKETMRKAYLYARAKIRDREKVGEEEKWRGGSASAMVINGEKLVIANMGDYRAVVCRNGVAHKLTHNHHQIAKRHWSHRFIPVRILACDSGNATSIIKHSKSSELVVGEEKINAQTEFVILASNGIWEVMKNQEAVNLIRHIENPQEAAECLAKEALTRMSRSNISCLIIRFD